MPTARKTITIEEARRQLGISRTTAYAAARTGEIPTIKIGRRLLVPVAQLKKMMESRIMNVPAKQPGGDIMESVLMKGDIAKLTPEERVDYYKAVCKSMGVNPLTKPFEFITLNGKLQLYALRTCTDQLRKINDISLEIVSKTIADDILTVHVRAKTPNGRIDEDFGSVPLAPNLRGEARSNAELKAVTKAKRRATLSICGLGWLDETEVESISPASKRPQPPAPNVMLPLHDPNTGEIAEDPVTVSPSAGQAAAERPASTAAPQHSDAGTDWVEYAERWHAVLEDATDARELGNMWNSAAQKKLRAELEWPEGELRNLMTQVGNRVAALKGTEAP